MSADADPAYDYTSYFDLDGTEAIQAPQKGGSGRIQLSGEGGVGSRLATPVMRNGLLWTCQTVGLDGMNPTYEGGATGSGVDRSAIQWIKFEVTPGGNGLVYSWHDRIFDDAETNPTWYYMPSLMVNCRMELVLGFSGSSEDLFVSAFYSWFANCTTSRPEPFQSGVDFFNEDLGDYDLISRWGDYSNTSLDPLDDTTFWTVQAYALPREVDPVSGLRQGVWGTWVQEVKRQ